MMIGTITATLRSGASEIHIIRDGIFFEDRTYTPLGWLQQEPDKVGVSEETQNAAYEMYKLIERITHERL